MTEAAFPLVGIVSHVVGDAPGGHIWIYRPGSAFELFHHALVSSGSVPRVRSVLGEPVLLPAYRHLASDYLQAALPVGLQVQRCDEPWRQPTGDDEAQPNENIAVGPWDGWPWSLLSIVPAATSAAYYETPATTIWHFQLARC